VKLAIIDCSNTWYAQPRQIYEELVKQGHECLWLARPLREGFKKNEVPPGFITVCVANNLAEIS